jgi:hypothetical protein
MDPESDPVSLNGAGPADLSDGVPSFDPADETDHSLHEGDSEEEVDETDAESEPDDGRSRNPAEDPEPGSPSGSSRSLPIYLKNPSASEQLAIAIFPMSTSNHLPGAKISSVSRNSTDGRIRCEIRDSIIHGREETTEGIPVDYHLLWESSNVPTNTYRQDYYAVKQNGRIFLTPAQTLHMRTVLEPKGTRQSESQRIGIVCQNNSREAQNAAGGSNITAQS